MEPSWLPHEAHNLYNMGCKECECSNTDIKLKFDLKKFSKKKNKQLIQINTEVKK